MTPILILVIKLKLVFFVCFFYLCVNLTSIFHKDNRVDCL